MLLIRQNVDYTVGGVVLEEIANYNEPAVLEAMRELEMTGHLPQDPTLVEDMYALALNMLPARYIQPTSMLSYRELHAPPMSEIRKAVYRALQIVNSCRRNQKPAGQPQPVAPSQTVMQGVPLR